jgi:hypothetical protein
VRDALAETGEALGKEDVSLEGGGAWVVDGKGVAHFLFEDRATARRALEAKGIKVLADPHGRRHRAGTRHLKGVGN